METLSDILVSIVSLILFGGISFAVWTAVKDKKQLDHAILKNFPLIGHARYTMERIGKYLRPWVFENDNEGKPFSRETRAKVYRMAKGVKNVLSFGSTSEPKTEFFAPALFPLEPGEADREHGLIIGQDCEKPYVQKRLFVLSGMSFGALSGNAIEALSRGAGQAGITMNTGEGGLPSKYHLSKDMIESEAGGKLVFQIGTANFGCRKEDGTIDYGQLSLLKYRDEIAYSQIKISQGAKPGRGGMLMGDKVTDEIAELRGIEAGKDCYSPSRNPSFSNPKELLEGIRKLKEVTGKPVGIKVSIGHIDELKGLLNYGMMLDSKNEQKESCLPSVITIDGGNGGTGAAPAVFMESIGVPIKDVIRDVYKLLVSRGIKDRVALSASGGLVTSHDVALVIAMGADWVESARGFMMAIGCINALDCAKGTCPVGIATQDPKLASALVPERKAVQVARYADQMEKELFDIALACGVDHPRKLDLSHVVVPNQNGYGSVIARFK